MAFDEEGNGVITKAELLKILKANHFASHDAEVARKADTIMAQSDKDGDGVITFDEFVIVSKKCVPPLPTCNLSTVSLSYSLLPQSIYAHPLSIQISQHPLPQRAGEVRDACISSSAGEKEDDSSPCIPLNGTKILG